MENGADFGPFLLVFAAALLGAKLLGEIAQRLGQPSVLGELVAGAVLGPSVLGLVPLTTSVLLVAEIGVVLLLFEVGLGTDLEELRRVGGSAISVAVVGMALPLLGGFLIVRAAGFSSLVALFAGAALTATSISITARVLSELKVLASREGQIILGAAVADDVLGLVVLAVVTQIVRTGQAIVGAFAAGLALARTNRRHDISRALNPVVDIFAPIFFVAIGAQVDVARLNPFDPANRFPLLLALGLTVVGVLGKFAAGFCAWGQVRRAFIGVGMIPRGEVGLIFASIGRQTGGLPQELFVAVVLAVFATTFLTPPLLKLLRPPVLGDRGEAQKP